MALVFCFRPAAPPFFLRFFAQRAAFGHSWRSGRIEHAWLSNLTRPRCQTARGTHRTVSCHGGIHPKTQSIHACTHQRCMASSTVVASSRLDSFKNPANSDNPPSRKGKIAPLERTGADLVLARAILPAVPKLGSEAIKLSQVPAHNKPPSKFLQHAGLDWAVPKLSSISPSTMGCTARLLPAPRDLSSLSSFRVSSLWPSRLLLPLLRAGSFLCLFPGLDRNLPSSLSSVVPPPARIFPGSFPAALAPPSALPIARILSSYLGRQAGMLLGLEHHCGSRCR